MKHHFNLSNYQVLHAFFLCTKITSNKIIGN